MNSLSNIPRPRRSRTSFHWLFIRIGLWASITILIILIVAGAWSYQQTNQLARQAQEQAGNGLAIGLANAVEEGIITRNFAHLEVQLAQVMNSEEVQSALVTDADGTILSEIIRNKETGAIQLVFNETGIKSPVSLKTTHNENSLEVVKPIGSTDILGWVKLDISTTKSTALLNGIHLQLLLIIALSVVIMAVIIGFSLRNTYSRVKSTQTEIEDFNDSLQAAAFYDQLTGLPNRHLLQDRLNQALALAARSRRQVAVCYVDLDGFKEINDNFGHDAGDIVLVEIAKRLTLAMRQHDTVARIGGDEFVLVISELDIPYDCQHLLNRILIDLAQPIDIGHHMVTISGSIGMVLSHNHGINPTTLITLADKAMYKAKRGGKDQWQLYDALAEQG